MVNLLWRNVVRLTRVCNPYNDTITNGIALCPNLHRAFDRGLIAIDDNFKVLVSQSFREDETNYSVDIIVKYYMASK